MGVDPPRWNMVNPIQAGDIGPSVFALFVVQLQTNLA